MKRLSNFLRRFLLISIHLGLGVTLFSCSQKKEGIVLVFKENLENPLVPFQKTLTLIDDKMKMDFELPQGSLTFFYQLGDPDFLIVIHPLQIITRSRNFSKKLFQDLSKKFPNKMALPLSLDNMGEIRYTKISSPKETREKVLNFGCELFKGEIKNEPVYESCLSSYKELGLTEREWQTFFQFQTNLEKILPLNSQVADGIRTKHYLLQKGNRLLSAEMVQAQRQYFKDDIFLRPPGYKKF